MGAQISVETMERTRVARFKRLTPTTRGFVDTAIPGYERLIYNVISRSYPGMAVSTKPRVVGVSRLKRATRVRSIVSTEICAPIVASSGSAAAPEIPEARRHDPVVRNLLLNQSESD